MLYRHYKGNYYEFLHEAIFEPDLTPMVVYRAPDGAVWVRAHAVFHELVEVDGKQVPRFARVPDEQAPAVLQQRNAEN